MSTKIFNYLFGGVVVIGFFMLLGTAGASDMGNIDLGTVLIQSLISVLIVIVGFIGLNVTNPKENN